MMIDVSRLYEFLIETKAEIEEINSVELVVDDSELVNQMEKKRPADNYILVSVVPEFDTSPSDGVDAIQHNNYLMFMVLKKLDYSSFRSQDERISFWNESQQVMKKLEAILIAAIETGADGLCPEFMNLDEKSIQIQPVWKFAQGNGWMLTVTIEK